MFATKMIERLDWLGVHKDVLIEHGHYQNGDPAFRLLLDDGEVLAVGTVNLEAYELQPDEGCVFIKDYADGTGLGDALVSAGVLEPAGRKVTFGPFDASASQYRFLDGYGPEGAAE